MAGEGLQVFGQGIQRFGAGLGQGIDDARKAKLMEAKRIQDEKDAEQGRTLMGLKIGEAEAGQQRRLGAEGALSKFDALTSKIPVGTTNLGEGQQSTMTPEGAPVVPEISRGEAARQAGLSQFADQAGVKGVLGDIQAQEDIKRNAELLQGERDFKIADREDRQAFSVEQQNKKDAIAAGNFERELNALTEKTKSDTSKQQYEVTNKVVDQMKGDKTIQGAVQMQRYNETLNQMWTPGMKIEREDIGPVDNALIKLLSLTLEPGLAVRQDDVTMAVGGQGALDRAKATYQKFAKGGSGFRNTYRDQMVKVANEIWGVAKKNYVEKLQTHAGRATKFGADIEDIFTPKQLGFMEDAKALAWAKDPANANTQQAKDILAAQGVQ